MLLWWAGQRCCILPSAYARFNEHHVARGGGWLSPSHIRETSASPPTSNIMDCVCVCVRVRYYSRAVLLPTMTII